MHPSLIALGLGQGVGAMTVGREAMRTRPSKYNSRDAYGDLANSYDGTMRQMNPGREPTALSQPIERVPDDTLGSKIDALRNTNNYLSSGTNADGYGQITINPHADRSMFAHELGHIASKQTDVGAILHKLRHNPALANSIANAALLTVPAGAIAALNPGDDDTAASIAVSLAAASPAILDEMSATKHALNIMDNADMRASLGQRGKLAGGLLSYMAAPIAVGALANLSGNQFDEDPKSPGELPVS